MKYIVTTTASGDEEIFIFPSSVNHDVMAESIQQMRNQTFGEWRRIRRTPVSAGFIEGGKCVGNSESLGLKAREIDSSMLLN